MHSPSRNYQSTSLYRSLVASKAILPTTNHEESRYIPNFTSVSKTYDVRHLDKFLNTTEYAHNASPTHSVNMPDAVITEATPRSYHGSPSEKAATFSVKARGSFFMKNDSRDSKIQQKEYLLSVLKDFGSKGAHSDYNTMALLSNVDKDSLNKHFNQNLVIGGKNYDSSKIDYVRPDDGKLMSPKARVTEMEEARMHQSEYAKWNEKIRGLTKKSRVYKNAFRSGVIGLDSPVNPGTMLYQEEGKIFQDMMEKTEKFNSLRASRLGQKAGTDPSLEFFNRKFDVNAIMPPVRVSEKNIKKQVDLPHVREWKDSNYRLFGDIEGKVSEERKQYLMEKETRGRKYDIISNRVDLARNKGQ